ncbi:polymorphic toxin-type HINT domain-containing protein, partial [Kitasatospora sp. NPDC059795]|uniref:polymorphic toxin-type HINT domain-containing protein n=1 Tax=Kitasatospora sp. NPDC059795 TaxID=3346949 RepID=UPI00365E1ACA
IVTEGGGALAAPYLKKAGNEVLEKVGGWLSGSRGRCKNSFPSGTRVLLADGSNKPIDQLTTNDTVIATDPQTGDTQPEPVAATIVTPDDTEFTDLAITTPVGKAAITSTQHHPYWDITTNRWADASSLEPGDQVLSDSDTTATVESVRNYQTEPRTAYNLTVADLHTYYVLAGATPVLVHNCGGELLDRARELYGTRADEASTVAVARVRSMSNPDKVETWVATERTGLPSEWKGGNAPLRGERYISGQGHAEATIMNRLGSDWEIVGMASSTRMCPTCFAQATGPGVGLTPSPIGKGTGVSSTGNTPWRVVLGGGG